MTHQWSFISNVFRLLADRSLQRFYKFCYQLTENLRANTDDPFFHDKYSQLLPFFTSFSEAYILKYGNKSQHKGDTILLNQLLKELSSTQARAWDVAIQNIFPKKSAEYAKIFPQGVTPLSTLSIEQRIIYLLNAITIARNYTQLATVCDRMNHFYMSLINARDTQEQKSANVKISIDDVMQKAYLLADEIYSVLGEFMSKYKNNPAQIAVYYPIFLLRYRKKTTDENPDIYEIAIDEGAKVEGGFSFNISDKINLYNTGETDLEVYFTTGKTDIKPSNTIKLLPQDIKTILIKDYANQDDRFLMIENLSTTEKGEIEISFV